MEIRICSLLLVHTYHDATGEGDVESQFTSQHFKSTLFTLSKGRRFSLFKERINYSASRLFSSVPGPPRLRDAPARVGRVGGVVPQGARRVRVRPGAVPRRRRRQRRGLWSRLRRRRVLLWSVQHQGRARPERRLHDAHVCLHQDGWPSVLGLQDVCCWAAARIQQTGETEEIRFIKGNYLWSFLLFRKNKKSWS